MNLAFSLKSRNAKTGNIPVSTSPASTCPSACPLKASGACYAKHGPLGMFWAKVNRGEAGVDWQTFIEMVRGLPEGRKVVICPAQRADGVSCKTCGLCANASRKSIVGFRAHGVSAKKAEAIAVS